MNKSIKTLVVGMLGVLLTTGAVATPAHAMSGIDFLKQNQQTQQYQTQVNKSYQHEVDGLVATKEDALKYEGLSVVNGDANQIVLVRNGAFASGWVGEGTSWSYYDPATNFLVRSQSRVINGKEYFFMYNGNLLVDCNKDGYYYGLDGAKTNSYNSNCSSTFNDSITVGREVDGKYTFEVISTQEYENRVSQGRIKASVGAERINGSDQVGHYLALFSTN